MGQVTFRLDADVAKAVDGFLKIVEAQRKAEKGLDQVKRKGQETQTVYEQIGSAAAGAGQSASSMVAGFMSITGAIALARQYQENLKQIRDLQTKIAQEVAGGQAGVEQAAARLGLTGDAGLQRTQAIVSQIVRKTGRSQGEVAGILSSAATEMGGSLEDKTTAATEMANFAAVAGLAPGEHESLWDLLGEAGADSPDKMRATFGRIQAAAKAAGSPIGDFSNALLKKGPQFMAGGAASLDETLAILAQSIAASGGQERGGAKLLGSLGDLLRDPGVQKLIQGQAGAPVEQLSATQELAALSRALQDPRHKSRLVKELGPDKLAELTRFAAQAETGQTAASAMATALPVPITTMPETMLGQQRAAEAEHTSRLMGTSPEEMQRGLLREEARRRLDLLKSRGRTTGLFQFGMETLSNLSSPASGMDAEELRLRNIAEAIQLERLGVALPEGTEPGTFSRAADRIPDLLRDEKRRRGIPEDATIGPQGQAVTPNTTVINNYGDRYYLQSEPRHATENPHAVKVP